MNEVWKPIEGYEGRYEVSNSGLVRSLNYHRTGKVKILKTHTDRYGYVCVELPKENNRRKHLTVHRLVAQAFVPNPKEKPEVNHKDGDKQNNCFSNLEWVTMAENQRHAWINGMKELSRRKSSERGVAKEVIERLSIYNNKRKKPIAARNLSTGEEKIYSSQREAANAINGDQGNILKVLKGRARQHKGYTFRYIDEEE